MSFVSVVSTCLSCFMMSDRGRGRSVSRVRTRSRILSPATRSLSYDDIDLDRVEPSRLLENLVACGVLPEPDAGHTGSDVPAGNPHPTS